MINLSGNPFYLDQAGIDWVNTTRQQMTLDEKIGQLFCPVGLTPDQQYLRDLIQTYHPCGIMFRPGAAEEIQDVHRFLQKESPIPLLIAANLENGGNGIILDGTEFGSQMQIAATHNVEHVEHLAEICAEEGKAVGCNWSYSPVADININPFNPITNTRTFGNKPEVVQQMICRYIEVMQSHGMASAIKHFPGDGLDYRDQHITTSINSMSCEEWDETYGKIYSAAIQSGVLSFMTGHINLPSYSRYFNPRLTDKEILPASLSHELLIDLLRNKLGFNGVISSDATPMLGFTSAMPRELAVPTTIAAGCDIFLFNKDISEDFGWMKAGLDNGILTEERIDDAVTRILAMKAALKLHQNPQTKQVPERNALSQIGNLRYHEWAQNCADQSITLVKDTADVLPISPNKQKNILLFTLDDDGDVYGNKNLFFEEAMAALKQEGFHIDLFDPSKFNMRDMSMPINTFKEKYDLALYLAQIKPASNKTSLRLHWARPMGINAPWFTQELPTIFVSFGNPYHLIDVPRIPTYINAYAATTFTLKAVIDKLLGRSEFTGISPIDPFVGQWDTKL